MRLYADKRWLMSSVPTDWGYFYSCASAAACSSVFIFVYFIVGKAALASRHLLVFLLVKHHKLFFGHDEPEKI